MIELRPESEANGYVYLDELVGQNCHVHLERMDTNWFCLIVEDGERRVMLNVGGKPRTKVNAGVYANEPFDNGLTICPSCHTAVVEAMEASTTDKSPTITDPNALKHGIADQPAATDKPEAGA